MRAPAHRHFGHFKIFFPFHLYGIDFTILQRHFLRLVVVSASRDKNRSQCRIGCQNAYPAVTVGLHCPVLIRKHSAADSNAAVLVCRLQNIFPESCIFSDTGIIIYKISLTYTL